MSATIGNMQEIGEFLNAYVYTKDFRPVQLTETLKINNEIFVINKDIDGSLKTKFNRKLNFDVSFPCIAILFAYTFFLSVLGLFR